jgi:hypothetical protein
MEADSNERSGVPEVTGVRSFFGGIAQFVVLMPYYRVGLTGELAFQSRQEESDRYRVPRDLQLK